MHKKRWITGLASLPFLVGLISWGGTVLFAWIIAAVSIIGIREAFEIISRSGHIRSESGRTHSSDQGLYFRVVAYIAGLAIVYASYLSAFNIMTAALVLNVMAVACISMSLFKRGYAVLEQAIKEVIVVAYIPLFLSHLVLIRNGTDGSAWIYFLLCLVFAGDIGAFYVGTYGGKHKLCPSISPGKTIEGAIGGLISNLAVGSIFKFLFLSSLPWRMSLLFFLVVGIAGQIGDLFESQLKRASNFKDSGRLFPGHGGLLDRIDALLFAAPVGYFLKEYLF